MFFEQYSVAESLLCQPPSSTMEPLRCVMRVCVYEVLTIFVKTVRTAFCLETETNSSYWAHLSRFHLKTETIRPLKRRVLRQYDE
jgi:hypothetical protein